MKSLSQKVCLLGDFAVGKTSLIRRFVYDLFDEKYVSTIGVKVSRKKMAIPLENDMVELTLMLWDLAGSEEFNRIRASYMRGAAGAILVCDLTRPDTLENLSAYREDLESVAPGVSYIVTANKCDHCDRQTQPDRIEAWAAHLNAPCYFTSAKTGEGVEDMFRHLGRILATGAVRRAV